MKSLPPFSRGKRGLSETLHRITETDAGASIISRIDCNRISLTVNVTSSPERRTTTILLSLPLVRVSIYWTSMSHRFIKPKQDKPFLALEKSQKRFVQIMEVR